MADSAGTIRDDLDFDVARPFDERFREEHVGSEGASGLGLASCEGLFEFARPTHGSRATSASTRDRLQHDCGPVRLLGEEGFDLSNGSRCRDSRDDRNIQFRCARTRCCFVAKEFEGVGGRADEGDPRLRARLRKRGVLTQEPVAGVERIAAL